MNEKFQEYLMGILEKTGEFLGSEIPEIAHQILRFGLAEGILRVIFYCLFVVLFLYIASYIKKIINNSDEPEGDKVFFVAVVYVITCVPLSITLFAIVRRTTEILKIWLAPKLYLLEYAADLVK